MAMINDSCLTTQRDVQLFIPERYQQYTLSYSTSCFLPWLTSQITKCKESFHQTFDSSSTCRTISLHYLITLFIVPMRWFQSAVQSPVLFTPLVLLILSFLSFSSSLLLFLTLLFPILSVCCLVFIVSHLV